MWEDPIVAEVHRTRRELAEKFEFDAIAIVADIRKRQAALGQRLVSVAQSAEPTLNANQDAHLNPTGCQTSEAAPAA